MNLQSPIISGNRVYKMYAGRLEKLGIISLKDFLYHIPSRYEDYSLVSKIAEVQDGEVVTIKGTMLDIKNQYLRGNKIKTIQKAVLFDDSGSIELTWFNQPYLASAIPTNSTIAASGRVERFGKKLSIQSPEYEILSEETNDGIHTGRLIPVYPETKGVSSKWLRRQIYSLLEEYKSELIEYLPKTVLDKNGFMDLKTALLEMHFPSNMEHALKAKERLAFDELFLMQLAALVRRQEWKQKQKSHEFEIAKYQEKIDGFIQSLPFSLTNAQKRAVNEIFTDIAKNKPMNRLLQGDVGSGKTVVSSIAMYAAYLNGFTSVLMAPTEILAEQHYATVQKFLSPFGLKMDLVTRSKKTLQELESGKKKNHDSKFLIPDSHILVGTHALLSEKIKLENLGLVVIDEQQRFGVEQRGLIKQKGEGVHLLTMTATPIPRTVALTMYGDLDLSYLNEMPVGRKRVKTWFVPPEKRDGAYQWIQKQVKETNSQVFIICPFIEESESMQTVKAASVEFEKLKREVYPDLRLGLLHGKLKSKEKEQVLIDFREGKFDILVATPVVEVGIDIPNATVIMIEASDRFGLAQLHQLRGRVGRGDKQSYCLLFADTKIDKSYTRLKAMETTYAGAELAELDLKLRGPGELYGTAQHGVPKLKVASFSDFTMIQRAKHMADEIFPALTTYPLLEEKVKEITVTKVNPD